MRPVKHALCMVVPVLDEGPNLAMHPGELQRFRKRGARVVVVDGGSSDSSLAIAADLADLAFVAPQGQASQMNAGAAVCTGDLLMFVHADTRLPHNADTLVRRATLGRSHWGRFDVAIDSFRPVVRIVEGLMNLRSRWTGIATGDQAIFVRKDLFDQIGGFPDQPLMEDVALSTRLKRHGPSACLHERITTSARRWEPHGPWRTLLLMWSLRAAYFFGATLRSSGCAMATVHRPPEMLQTVQIAIMAKAPIPGLAKTRLIPALDAIGAARLQRRPTRMTVACALDARLGAVTVWCTPDSRHRFFRALKRTNSVDVLVQSGGDLGARRHTAFRLHCVLGPLIVVGTDCLMLRPEHLREAAQALIAGDDAVFYPAEDGGYALVGLRAPQPTLAADMPWSTSRVMSETRARAHAQGLRVREFDTLWDVDLPAQLERLEALLAKAVP